MLRAVLAGLGAACVTTAALIAPSSAVAADDTRSEIPLPTFQVREVCGPANDIITIDPAWQAAWGDKVNIYGASLTFQNGGEYARPAGQILSAYRNQYRWVGTSGQDWSTWSLYPGTVAPILDKNTSCDTRTEIPVPTVQVTEVCGPRNDTLTVDPAWLAQWGDKVTIYPASLTFQGGSDGDYAKPAGQILSSYRADYKWAGTTGQEWTTWSLYPGTVTPVLDKNTACAAATPAFTSKRVWGPHNDRFTLTQASAQQWSVVSAWWEGQVYTVVLKPRDGFVTADGAATTTVTFTDSHVLKG